MLDLINIVIAIIALGNFTLAIYALLQSRNNKINRVFAYLSCSVVVWCITMIIYREASAVNTSILGAQFLYASAASIAYVFLLFTFIFPFEKNGLKNIYKIIFTLPFAFITISCFIPNWIIKDILIQQGQEKQIIFGFVYSLYVVYIPVYFNLGFFNLIKKNFKLTGLYKMQIRYIFAGSLISAVLGMTTNLILPSLGIFTFNWFGQIATITFIGCIAYAILRYRLMDIRLILRSTTVYSLILLLIGICGLLSWQYLPFGPMAKAFVILAEGLTLFYSLPKLLMKAANKYIFGMLYAQHKNLERLNKKLTTIIDLDELLNLIVQTTKNSLGLEQIAILLKDKESKQYKPEKVIGFAENKLQALIKNNLIAQYFNKNKKPIVSEETPELKIKEKMQYLKAGVCLPLISKNELEGMIILGKKPSGDAYTKEDLELLETLANQTSIAIENARLYTEVNDLKQNLEQKVTEQTKSITELLGMKAEFLNTVSHQLKTPTSIFRSMLSMINEGDVIGQQREQFIKDSYSAANRLLLIIDSIMEASAFEGKFPNFDFKAVQADEIINQSMTIFKVIAKAKKIDLEYQKPKEILPALIADEHYLKSALNKLLDNAIWYTPKKGKVIISTEYNKQDNAVSIKVQDTGIGLTQEDKNVLFQKFKRGRGSKTMNVNSSGLSLFIAKQIIEAHKGAITAQSEGENQGSAFTITIPVLQEV